MSSSEDPRNVAPADAVLIVEPVFREAHGRVLAFLTRLLGDLSEAEDAVQEAYASALETWPRDGIPERPAAWLTTVARNAATSVLRHRAVVREKHALIVDESDASTPSIDDGDDPPDERLRLLFTCCHPALAEDARVALTLHTLCGLSTTSIASLFFTSEPAIAQRLVRAKRKIRTSGIPYRVPPPEEIDERIDTVLAVVYLLFTAGYASVEGDLILRPDVCEEAIRLGRVLTFLCPSKPEPRGLLALMQFHHARRAGRADAEGDLVPLDRQDRTQWDAAEIAEGTRQLEEALAHEKPGPYQIQAAIAALHAQAATAAATDWAQIAGLYAELRRRAPSPAVGVAMVFAEGMAHGPDWGLQRLDEILARGELERAHGVNAVRAELLRRADRPTEASVAFSRAIQEARTERERTYLVRRMAECQAMLDGVSVSPGTRTS